MASWIAHQMIADALLARLPSLDRRGFCVGSVAPDCNVPNGDGTFTPAREITHCMTGPGKETANFEGFYARFAAHGLSPLARGFLLGYCVHLIADARFQRFIRDPGRVKAMFARLKRDPAARERLSGQPETFDAVKAAFGRAAVFRDVAAWEAAYLRANPHSGYIEVLCGLREFPDVLEILPGSMIAWKIRQNAHIPEGIPAHDGCFFPADECGAYLRETCAFSMAWLRGKGVE